MIYNHLDGSFVKVIITDKEVLRNDELMTVFEEDNFPPFDIKRMYIISNVKEGTTRGNHSHKKLKQVLISINGSITVTVDDGANKNLVVLDSHNTTLYIGPNIWRTMTWNDDFATLIVLASENYDESDYIRSYDKFLKGRKNEINSF